MINHHTLTKFLTTILILFCFQSCVRDYANPLFISENAKTYLPYQPGEELIFRNTTGDTLIFVTSAALTSIITNTENYSNKLYIGSHYYYESIELKSFQKKNRQLLNNCFTTRIYMIEDSENGRYYEFCEVNINFEKSNHSITYLADNYYDFNSSFWWYFVDKSDSFEISGKMFYDVYKTDNLFCSKNNGIIAFETDSTLWMNVKYL